MKTAGRRAVRPRSGFERLESGQSVAAVLSLHLLPWVSLTTAVTRVTTTALLHECDNRPGHTNQPARSSTVMTVMSLPEKKNWSDSKTALLQLLI